MKTLFLKFMLLLFILCVAVDAGTFDIKTWSIDSGVAKSHSNSFSLNATLGQSESGKVLQSTKYKLWGGFWFKREKDVYLVPIITYLLD